MRGFNATILLINLKDWSEALIAAVNEAMVENGYTPSIISGEKDGDVYSLMLISLGAGYAVDVGMIDVRRLALSLGTKDGRTMGAMILDKDGIAWVTRKISGHLFITTPVGEVGYGPKEDSLVLAVGGKQYHIGAYTKYDLEELGAAYVDTIQ